MTAVSWRGMNAAYTDSERELMRDLPVREQALVHTLKHFTHGELGINHEREGIEPPRLVSNDLGESERPPAVYTDPEDIPFGTGRPKKTRPIYALVWTHKQHKVYKTKAKAQRASRAWKLWHERWGFKVSSHATGFFALKGDEKRACLIHEYDKETKERLK